MVLKCLVRNCKSSYNSRSQDNEVHLYRFPKDENLKKQWVRLCGYSDASKIIKSKLVICSLHFDKNAFTMKSRLGFSKGRNRILEQNAVPSLHLPTSSECLNNLSNSSPDELSSGIISAETISRPDFQRKKKEVRYYLLSSDNKDGMIELLKRQNIYLKQKLDAARNSIRELRLEIAEQKHHILSTESKVDDLTQKIILAERGIQNRHDSSIRNALSKRFTESQIQMLLTDANRGNWADEDLKMATTLRDISVRAYDYIRESMKYPLPCMSTLRRWECAQMQERIKVKEADLVRDITRSQEIGIPTNACDVRLAMIDNTIHITTVESLRESDIHHFNIDLTDVTNIEEPKINDIRSVKKKTKKLILQSETSTNETENDM